MIRFTSTVPVLRVADVARSVAWYRDALGFSATTTPVDPPFGAATLLRDDAELVLRKGRIDPARFTGPDDWDVYLRLTGNALTELLDHARRLTPLVRGPEVMPSGWVEFELQDPDGHRICIAEQLADSRAFPPAAR